MMGVRRVLLGGLVWLLVSGGGLAFSGAGALAAVTREPVRTIGEGTFTAPTDVTVDQSNGNVYVTDSGASVVDVFGAEGGSPAGGVLSPLAGAGTPAGSFNFTGLPAAVAIDESGGSSSRDLYVADPRHRVVDRFTLNGTTGEYEYVCQIVGYGSGCLATGETPTWRKPAGVAVDSAGNLHVATIGFTGAEVPGGVFEFDPSGGNVSALVEGSNQIREPAGVAVDAGGVRYVNNYHASVVKVEPGGSESVLDHNTSTGVAVDSAGVVFVDDGTYIAEYDSQGHLLGRFGEGLIGSGSCAGEETSCSEGIAVNDSTGEIYVSDREADTVKVFGAPVTIPDATTEGASSVRKSTATVSGTVNPDGAGEAHYSFKYRRSGEEAWLETPEASAGSGSTGEPESAELTELAPQTTYQYRLVARNANGSNEEGGEREFTTAPAVTIAPCPAPHPPQALSAALCGSIDPEGLETTYYYQFGSSTEYEFRTPEGTEEPTGTGVGAQEFPLPVTGLQPTVTYHYRLVATNTLGTTFGPDQTLTTPPVQPTVNDQSPFATEIAAHEATLHGTINPGQGITTYQFLYGPTAAYGSSTTQAYTQLNYQQDAIEQLVTQLTPNTTYHYALVATNSSGTTTGPDQTFTTLPEPVVEAGTEQPPATPALSAALTLPLTPALLPSTVFPLEGPVTPPPPRSETRAQKLARALKACAKQPKKKRVACIKQARKKYGPTKKKRK